MTKCRVLIVDDEPALLLALASLIGESYTMFTAMGATTALQVLDRERIDVIVADFQMPGMDGLALLIEAKRRFPRVVRVLMTAYADMALIVRALNEGEIQRFIAKPYRPDEFCRILAECRSLAAAETRSGPSRGSTVLLAHDSPTCQSAVRRTLSPAFEVITTGNGLEAINVLATRQVDAVVLGVKLELLDGCTIATYLKKERASASPVVFLSSDVAGPFGDYLRECGADLVLDQHHPDSLPRLQRFLSQTLV